MDYIFPSLCIEILIGMVDHGASKQRLAKLMEVKEDQFLPGFHQQVQKEREKMWHNHLSSFTF